MSRWKVPHHFKVMIGGNRYIDCTTIIEYKGKSLFELRRSDSDGFLFINFDLYAHYGSKLGTIRNGQFVGDKPPGYRIETSYDHFELIETETSTASVRYQVTIKSSRRCRVGRVRRDVHAGRQAAYF